MLAILKTKDGFERRINIRDVDVHQEIAIPYLNDVRTTGETDDSLIWKRVFSLDCIDSIRSRMLNITHDYKRDEFIQEEICNAYRLEYGTVDSVAIYHEIDDFSGEQKRKWLKAAGEILEKERLEKEEKQYSEGVRFIDLDNIDNMD